MNKMILIAIAVSTCLVGSVMTETPARADKPVKAAAKGPKPVKMTCQEFVELDDVQKPKLVYWAEGFDRKGNAEDAVFDVENTDRIVPKVVDDCKSAPKESFWKKVKAEFKKEF